MNWITVIWAAKGAITSKIKHAIKHKTSPARLAQLLCKSCRTCFMFYCMFYFTCDRSLMSTFGILCRWQLEQSVRCAGNVEVWLGELLAQQMKALHTIIRLASQFINDQEFQLLAFINEAIAQVSLYHTVQSLSLSVYTHTTRKRYATKNWLMYSGGCRRICQWGGRTIASAWSASLNGVR